MSDSLPTALQLEVVTPNRAVVHDTIEEVSTPGKEGYLGILPGHAPLLSQLQTGELSYKKSGRTYYLSIGGGFLEVLPDRVTILTPTAERTEEVDLDRAEKARQRSEKRLQSYNDPEIDFERARAAFNRALTRIQVARRP